jgi:cytochrome c oxidase assembly protein subunit 15
MPSGPVTHQKAWIEMVHRYLATSVGALIALLTLLAWWDARSGRKEQTTQSDSMDYPLSPWWPTITLFWVCVQGAFGALTVTMKLFPAIVSLHLLGAYALLALLVVQAVKLGAFRGEGDLTVPAGTGLFGVATLCLLLLQATSGAWVSTNYAVLVCGEFPTCQGSWWPEMNFAAALEVWRPLGEHGDGSIVSLPTLTAIHVLHRLLAVVTTLGLAGLAMHLWRRGAFQKPVRVLAALMAMQLATGLSNVVLDWPIAAAMLHSGGAGALVAVLVWMGALTRLKGRAA